MRVAHKQGARADIIRIGVSVVDYDVVWLVHIDLAISVVKAIPIFVPSLCESVGAVTPLANFESTRAISHKFDWNVSIRVIEIYDVLLDVEEVELGSP